MQTRFFSKLFLFLSLLIFCYIFYKSEIYWNSSLRDYYGKYYIISFILIGISVLTFFLSNEFTRYFVIIITSLICGLYLIEIYLRTIINILRLLCSLK